MEETLCGPLGYFVDPNSFYVDKSQGCQMNWAQAYYSDGLEMTRQSVDEGIKK